MNITIISDVHIGDYPNYETYRFERLNWYRNYADEVIETSRSKDSHYLFIAGDLFDRSTNSPEIQNVVRDVINKFDSYFDKIYYINGQHDLKTKDYDDIDNEKQSAIRAMSTNKMIYGGYQILKLGGRSIAMMDFNAEPDLSWIEGKVDLFIGHVTINTSGFGSELDYDKFTLGIAGDIHYPCHKNNLYSVGIGIPRYKGDANTGTYVICNLEDLSFKRIEVDPKHEWLTRYVWTDNPDIEGPSEEKLLNGISPKFYYIYSPTQEVILPDKIELSDSRVSNINDIIADTIRRNNLQDIHSKVLSSNQIYPSVDLNFELVELEITNIRSIDHHILKFDNKSGILQLAASNGGGKSSVIWSLNYALRGGLDIRNEVREGETYAAVQLKLKYQGKLYTIYRGTDEVDLAINDEWLPLGGKRDTENAIYEYLPFIYYIDSYFFADDSTRILGSYSAERRIELLSTYYRLDVIQSYHDVAATLQQEIVSQNNSDWTLWQDRLTEKDNLEERLSSEKDEVKDLVREVLEGEISTLQKEYDKAVIRESKLKVFDSLKAERELNKLPIIISEDKKKLSVNEEKLKSLQEKLPTLKKGRAYKKSEYNMDYKQLVKVESEVDSLRTELTKKKGLLEKFDSLFKVNCPKCDTEIHISNQEIIDKEELSAEVELLTNKLNEEVAEYNQLNADFKVKTSEDDEYNIYTNHVEKIKDTQSQITILRKAINDNEDKQISLQNDLDEYRESNNFKKPGSIQIEIDAKKRKLIHFDNIDSIKNELASERYTTELTALEDTYNKSTEELNRYNLYQQLFSSNGELYKLVLNTIVSKFNSESFKYEVVTQYYRGKEYTDIVGYYKNYKMKNWREYSHCSNGQKTLLDINFIKNLVTNCGVIVFDDFLGYLTTDNLFEGLKMIHDMKSKLKIITSQNENTNYVNHCITLTYDGSVTQFSE